MDKKYGVDKIRESYLHHMKYNPNKIYNPKAFFTFST